jgi:hypothetical protein
MIVASIFAAYFLTTGSAQRQPRVFSHNTRAHKEGKFKDCSSCHALPEQNWTAPRSDKLEPFPDVTNFPYKQHTTCNTCHIKEVYSDGGVFCGSCHVNASMRAKGGAGMLDFPNKRHLRQFKTLFPHDVHQDLLAQIPKTKEYAPAHFTPVSFSTAASFDDKPKPKFYNCSICHKSYLGTGPLPKYETRKPFAVKGLSPLGTDTFERPLTAAFFKSSPDGHESCFSCHYQFQNLPVGQQSCAGCHALVEPFKPYSDRNLKSRYSLKFDHSREGHVEKDCMSCHLRITQNPDVRLKDEAGVPVVADVPLVSCKGCHDTQDDSAAWRQIVQKEIESRDKSAAFQCSYCHTSAVGRFEVPASHRKP